MSAITENAAPSSEPRDEAKGPQGGALFRLLRWLVGLYHPRNLREKSLLWLAVLNLITALMLVAAYMIYISREPEIFNVRTTALNAARGDASLLEVPGYVTTATVARIARTILDKPGGYIRNDVLPPFFLLDNIPSWEFGVLKDLRDSSRALRDHLARAQTQSQEDEDLRIFDAHIHFDDNAWILPATEDEYEAGISALNRFQERLASGDARFYERTDNLYIYLATVEKRLGDYAHELSLGVTGLEFTAYSAVDDSGNPDIPSGDVETPTPWMQVDNVFYEVRGYIWSLTHVLKAIEMDFHDMLAGKNALDPLRQIIYKLENTQNTIYSPLIMNNSGYGILTNHSLAMASFISRANAALIDLRILLEQG